MQVWWRPHKIVCQKNRGEKKYFSGSRRRRWQFSGIFFQMKAKKGNFLNISINKFYANCVLKPRPKNKSSLCLRVRLQFQWRHQVFGHTTTTIVKSISSMQNDDSRKMINGFRLDKKFFYPHPSFSNLLACATKSPCNFFLFLFFFFFINLQLMTVWKKFIHIKWWEQNATTNLIFLKHKRRVYLPFTSSSRLIGFDVYAKYEKL